MRPMSLTRPALAGTLALTSLLTFFSGLVFLACLVLAAISMNPLFLAGAAVTLAVTVVSLRVSRRLAARGDELRDRRRA